MIKLPSSFPNIKNMNNQEKEKAIYGWRKERDKFEKDMKLKSHLEFLSIIVIIAFIIMIIAININNLLRG